MAAKNLKASCSNIQPGCELFRRRCQRGIAIAAVAILAPVVLTSCAGAGADSQASTAAPIRLADVDKKKADPKDMLILISYKVCVLQLPIGSASTCEELWNYLDQERVQCVSGDRLSLRRNGMRVGIGKSGNWPEIAAILNRLTGRQLSQASGIIVPGQAHPIVLKDNQPPQTIFIVNEDQTLSGADYPEGRNTLTLMCTLNQEDPGAITLTAVPQISTTQRNMSLEQESGNYTLEFKPTFYSFSQLTFRSILSDNDIIVVSPGSLAMRENSLGHHFFIDQKDGLEVETLLVLVPEVVAKPVRR